MSRKRRLKIPGRCSEDLQYPWHSAGPPWGVPGQLYYPPILASWIIIRKSGSFVILVWYLKHRFFLKRKSRQKPFTNTGNTVSSLHEIFDCLINVFFYMYLRASILNLYNIVMCLTQLSDQSAQVAENAASFSKQTFSKTTFILTFESD